MENIDEFIRQNAEFLTIPDMAEETGLSQADIRYRCIALKITPVKKRDQALQFVKDHCYTKTPEEIAKKGGYPLVYLRDIYKELGISFRRQLFKAPFDENKGAESELPPDDALTVNQHPQQMKGKTPRKILSDFQYGNHHYHCNDGF